MLFEWSIADQTSSTSAHYAATIFLQMLQSPSTVTFFFKSLIIKPTTLNTNEQETIGGAVADPAACVVSMPPKYQHVVSSLGSEE